MTWARITDTFPATTDNNNLSVSAVYLYIRAMQNGIAGGTDGIISVVSARLLLQAKAIRNKDRVIAELVDAGLWTWVDETTLQQDWTGQETAADKAVKLDTRAKAQADYVSRNRRCAADDHSMCAGTKRRCQRQNDDISDDPHSNTTPPHPTTKPDPPRSRRREDESDGSAQAPPGQRSPAGASTLPGPSSEDETGASNQGASNNPQEGASKQGASTNGWVEVDLFSGSEFEALFERLDKVIPG